MNDLQREDQWKELGVVKFGDLKKVVRAATQLKSTVG